MAPGPNAALQLILLWIEGKHSATLPELERWESIVIEALNRLEDKLEQEFGRDDGIPDYTDPSET